MNVHGCSSASWTIWVYGRSWTRLTAHEFYECLICCPGTFLNSSMNTFNESSWMMNFFGDHGRSWTNLLSSWPFSENPCSWARWEFMNRISSWTHEFHKSLLVVQEYSWTVHAHVDKRWWTFIVYCSRTFMNYSWIFMNGSWSFHRVIGWCSITLKWILLNGIRWFSQLILYHNFYYYYNTTLTIISPSRSATNHPDASLFHNDKNIFSLKGLAQAKIIKKSVILFWLLNITIWCKHVHRLELQIF